jgi:hypothetical protein
VADLFHPALVLSICLTIANSAFADSSDRRYAYDARMAFIKAGQLTLDLNRSGDSYEVAGQFQTSRAMSAYYTWNGLSDEQVLSGILDLFLNGIEAPPSAGPTR